MKKLIGQVNSQERVTIQMLFERKSGLGGRQCLSSMLGKVRIMEVGK